FGNKSHNRYHFFIVISVPLEGLKGDFHEKKLVEDIGSNHGLWIRRCWIYGTCSRIIPIARDHSKCLLSCANVVYHVDLVYRLCGVQHQVPKQWKNGARYDGRRSCEYGNCFLFLWTIDRNAMGQHHMGSALAE